MVVSFAVSQTALGVGEVVGDDHVVEISAEVALGRDADRLERNRRIGPQVGLHGALVVDLVEDLLLVSSVGNPCSKFRSPMRVFTLSGVCAWRS